MSDTNRIKWTNDLSSPDIEVRRTAVAGLAALAGADAVAPLVRALGDADWRVRKEAARVAAAHAEARPGLLPALLEALETPANVGLHNAAVEALVGIGTQAVPVLLARLPFLDAGARRFALEALGDIGDPAALPALLAAARDTDPNLRASAIEALGRIGGPETDRALVAVLETESDPFLRLAALESGLRAGTPLESDLLLPMVEDRILRRAALQALAGTRAVAAVAALSSALRDHARSTATTAVLGLAQLSDEVALEHAVASELDGAGPAELGLLEDLARAGSLAERQAAVRLLGLCRAGQAAALLAQAAADDDLAGLVETALRQRGPAAAADLLSAMPETPPRALPVVLPVLVDLALGGPSEAGVAERLGELLGAGDDLVASAAAEGLGALGSREAIGPLVARLGAGTPRLVRSAGHALAQLGGRWPEEVRRALAGLELEGGSAPVLAGLLGAVGTAEDVPRLRAALGSDQVALRRASVEALARLGGEAAADAVILALADESTDVQAAAAAALGRIGGPRAAESLRPALSSSSATVVAAAAAALGELGDEECLGALRELAGSSHGAVAAAALEALGRLGERGIAAALDDPTLEAALQHSDAEVVKKGLRWVGRDRARSSVDRLVRALAHDAWDVRHLAARLLGGLGLPVARDALLRRRETETDALVLAAIAEALGS